MNKTYYNIDVAIIGSVSSGKSTFINALFSKFYSETKMTRTTMCPQIYMESDTSDDNIFEASISANDKSSGKINSINELFEIKHRIGLHNNNPTEGQNNNMIEYPCKKNLRINFHDLPGLNDVETRDIYYEYVKTNFHKYDIVIYIIDIKSALNTSDEADILNLVFEQIELNKSRYGIMTKLIILINKCDKMIIDGNNVILDPDNEEYNELYKQILRVVNDKNVTNLKYSIVPISCENSFIYNLIINSPEKLTDAQMNKVGIDFFGGIYWKKLDCEKKRERLVNYMGDVNNVDIIKSIVANSGFLNFKRAFNKLFCGDKYLEFVLNEFKVEFTDEISQLTLDPTKNEYDNFIIMIKQINLLIIGVKEFFEEVFEVFDIDAENFKKQHIFTNIKKVIKDKIKTLIAVLKNSKYYSQEKLNVHMSFNLDKINIENCTIFKDDSTTLYKMTIHNIKSFKTKLDNFLKNNITPTVEDIKTFLTNITVGNSPKYRLSQTSINVMTQRIYSLHKFRIRSLCYIKDLCKIYDKLQRLSNYEKYFEINVCSNLSLQMLNHIIESSYELIGYLTANTFNAFKLCELLNILIIHNITIDNNATCKYIFTKSSSLIDGKSIIYDVENPKKQINIIDTDVVTHDIVGKIIDYFSELYRLDSDTVCSIRMNIIINMYRHILKTKSLAFISNNKSLLFQMNKFWNNRLMDEMVLPKEFKEQFLEIQYLATCAKRLVVSDTYEEFIVDDLGLENSIKSYLQCLATSINK